MWVFKVHVLVTKARHIVCLERASYLLFSVNHLCYVITEQRPLFGHCSIFIYPNTLRTPSASSPNRRFSRRSAASASASFRLLYLVPFARFTIWRVAAGVTNSAHIRLINSYTIPRRRWTALTRVGEHRSTAKCSLKDPNWRQHEARADFH